MRAWRVNRRRAGVVGLAAALSGCSPRPWVAVNITRDEATVMRVDAAGASHSFTAAILEHTPRLLQNRLADYWTVRTTVDCRDGTYRLGETTAFRADGRRLAVDAGLDPPARPAPGSIEASEVAFACNPGGGSLPPVVAGDLPTMLQRFRTGVIVR